MSQDKPLSLVDLGFQLPNGQFLFKHLTTHIQPGVSALVGCNGVGKSLLMQLIAGQLEPTEGQVLTGGKIAYVAQSAEGLDGGLTIRDLLGLTRPLAAIDRITAGSITEADFELAEGYWDWEVRLEQDLVTIGWQYLPPLERRLMYCSGGEQMRLMWLKAIRLSPDWFILDEPSNHLDARGRKFLYRWLKHSEKNVLIVSHDRELLRHVSCIYELTPKGMHIHGGNYDCFVEEQTKRFTSQQTQLYKQQKQLKTIKNCVQISQEKLQRRLSSGKQKAKRTGASALEIGMAKESAGQNQQRIKLQLQQQHNQVEAALIETKQALEWHDPIGFELSATAVSTKQSVLSCYDLEIGYEQPLNAPINIQMSSSERLHLKGENGSGKSTLLKTVLGYLPPISGDFNCHVKTAYLDQHLTCLAPELTALDNFKRHNNEMREEDCYLRLSWLGLRGQQAEKRVNTMSGGEQLKVALACCLLGTEAPQLLLLDEPGNHLDLAALQALEDALNQYQGAMIIVSHDQDLVENLKPDRVITL